MGILFPLSLETASFETSTEVSEPLQAGNGVFFVGLPTLVKSIGSKLVVQFALGQGV